MLPDDYITAYTKLVQDFAQGNKKDVPASKRFCAFAPLHGKEWRGDIMFYGRALNQWPVRFTCDDIAGERSARPCAGPSWS